MNVENTWPVHGIRAGDSALLWDPRAVEALHEARIASRLSGPSADTTRYEGISVRGLGSGLPAVLGPEAVDLAVQKGFLSFDSKTQDSDSSRSSTQPSSTKFSSPRSLVYEDLWDRGFYISRGLRFGGDFLIYSANPHLYHSQFVVNVLPFPAARPGSDKTSRCPAMRCAKSTCRQCGVCCRTAGPLHSPTATLPSTDTATSSPTTTSSPAGGGPLVLPTMSHAVNDRADIMEPLSGDAATCGRKRPASECERVLGDDYGLTAGSAVPGSLTSSRVSPVVRTMNATADGLRACDNVGAGCSANGGAGVHPKTGPSVSGTGTGGVNAKTSADGSVTTCTDASVGAGAGAG
eukprot:Rmarinus@m.7913